MKKALMIQKKILVFFFGWAILVGVINVPSSDPAVWRFYAELIPFTVMVVFTILFVKLERGEVLIPIKNNWEKGTVTGIIIGLIWIGLSAGILLAAHQLKIVGRTDVHKLWLWMVSAFINVVMQELLVRGYIYQLLKKNYRLPFAVFVTTVLFTLLHGGAFEAGLVPVLNVVTMCLFTTALYEAEGTLLAPIMAHAVWNIVGSIILSGVSLADDYPSLYSMAASGNVLFSGGEYRIEGSIVVLMINIALMLYFCLRYKKTQNNMSQKIMN